MKRILIVDDEYIPRQASPEGNYMWYFVKALDEVGFSITSTKGPDAAKARLKTKKGFALVVLDLMMPVGRQGVADSPEQLALSGVILAEWIVQHFPAIPILILTNTKSSGVHRRLCACVPRERVFIKPETTPFTFLRHVRSIIGDPN